jgi:hypothetical protein
MRKKKVVRKRIPQARYLRRSPESRVDVTRAEYNAIIDILNQRNVILNALRESLERLERAVDIQFKRTAEIQVELDEVRRAWQKLKSSS